MVQYETLDFENPHCNPPPVVSPVADNDVVELFLKRFQPGDIMLSYITPKDWEFCSAVLSKGLHREMIGSDGRMLIARNVKAAKEAPCCRISSGRGI